MALVADMRQDAIDAQTARYDAIKAELDRLVAAAPTKERVSEDDLRTAHYVAGALTEDWGVLGTFTSSLFTRQPLLGVTAGQPSAMQTSLNSYLTTVLGLTAIVW